MAVKAKSSQPQLGMLKEKIKAAKRAAKKVVEL